MEYTQPETVRLRVGAQAVQFQSWRPAVRIGDPPAAGPVPVAITPPAPPAPDLCLAPPPPAPAPGPSVPRGGLAIGYKPLIALIQATPCRAADLALTLLAMLEQSGYRCGVLCLDQHNTLGARFGCAGHSPHWTWRQPPPELFTQQGSRTVVPAPDTEGGMDPESVGTVLQTLIDQTDAVIVDLGCRWEPRLFQPVLGPATHIWVLTEPGKWTALEMRLEQAEFSGWTAMARVRSVALGEGGQPSPRNIGIGAVHLPDVRGKVACEFLARELGRSH